MTREQVVNGKVRIKIQAPTTNNATWVAKINGLDSKSLLQPRKSQKSNGYIYYDLEDGGIYEINEPREGLYFITVSNKQVLELKEEEVEMLLEKQGKILTT